MDQSNTVPPIHREVVITAGQFHGCCHRRGCRNPNNGLSPFLSDRVFAIDLKKPSLIHATTTFSSHHRSFVHTATARLC